MHILALLLVTVASSFLRLSSASPRRVCCRSTGPDQSSSGTTLPPPSSARGEWTSPCRRLSGTGALRRWNASPPPTPSSRAEPRASSSPSSSASAGSRPAGVPFRSEAEADNRRAAGQGGHAQPDECCLAAQLAGTDGGPSRAVRWRSTEPKFRALEPGTGVGEP